MPSVGSNFLDKSEFHPVRAKRAFVSYRAPTAPVLVCIGAMGPSEDNSKLRGQRMENIRESDFFSEKSDNIGQMLSELVEPFGDKRSNRTKDLRIFLPWSHRIERSIWRAGCSPRTCAGVGCAKEEKIAIVEKYRRNFSPRATQTPGCPIELMQALHRPCHDC